MTALLRLTALVGTLLLIGTTAAARAEVRSLSGDLAQKAPGLSRHVLLLALRAARCAQRTGLAETDLLTVIDYSRPSVEPRLWVFDLAKRELLFHELVAHGQGSGLDEATDFSNRQGSRQSSLGLFRTGKTYRGRNGYSLKLHGLEQGFNELAFERAIVVHGARYVSPEFAEQHGRLGRSWGCPALDREVARDVIDTIEGGSLLFSYYPYEHWLVDSELLRCEAPSSAPLTSSARE